MEENLQQLKIQMKMLARKINNIEIEEKKKASYQYLGKCYRDTTCTYYYKIIKINSVDNVEYISVDSKEKDIAKCISIDYEYLSEFADAEDIIEITSKEFNSKLEEIIKKIKEI